MILFVARANVKFPRAFVQPSQANVQFPQTNVQFLELTTSLLELLSRYMCFHFNFVFPFPWVFHVEHAEGTNAVVDVVDRRNQTSQIRTQALNSNSIQ